MFINVTVQVVILFILILVGAAATTMFSAKYDADTETSANLVSVSTLIFIITMPLIITLAQYVPFCFNQYKKMNVGEAFRLPFICRKSKREGFSGGGTSPLQNKFILANSKPD